MREKVALIAKIRAIESVPKIRFKVRYLENHWILFCILWYVFVSTLLQ